VALVGHDDPQHARPGLVELAEGGTLLVQEIGALSLEAQSEIVRLLASGDVVRGGPTEAPFARPVDVRVVATTGRVGDAAIASDTLLPDLHDRLRGLVIDVPPLRERRGDLLALAESFAERARLRHGLGPRRFSDDAAAALELYDWPGNVRQLRAVVEHAVASSRGPRIGIAELPPLADHPPTPETPTPAGDILEGTYDAIEREVLVHALARAGGNKAEAARRLGMKRTTLASRLKKAGL
jgi:DNA-binding NtrC family response regulator